MSMKIFVMRITLRAVWAHSLKEKRMVVKSLTQKLKNKFNISVREVAEQDVHQTVVIGIAGIGASWAQVDSITENITSFVDENTEAELMDVQVEREQY